MADRPILFSGPMVRALLAGTKTQTRRVLSNDKHASLFNGQWADSYVLDPGNAGWREREVRFAEGDRLYVREAWRSDAAYDDLSPAAMGGDEPIRYEADGAHQAWGYPAISKPGRFRQGMHMPRWASRLTLIVTEVRVQRLQEIIEADAIAEGVECWSEPGLVSWRVDDAMSFVGAVDAYRLLWDSLNADRGYGWSANPWVVAYSFTVHLGNIDQIGRAS
ncbi:hypothetical protein [Aliihoeflea sp. 2WW]|uniref:hypothetical protein n=1 Tax=Aliihoeflea sp. 2WW TaxID=1381123 RepID=UPI0004638600|nr:hypothetical protein [Aliihoeflea sp. 2WW]